MRILFALSFSILIIGCTTTASQKSTPKESRQDTRELHLKQNFAITVEQSNTGYTPVVPIAPELERDAKKAQESFGQAITLMQQGQSIEAESLLLSLTEEYPGLSGPWLNLGLIKTQAKEWEYALEHFTKAITANPQNTYAHTSMGLALRELGRFEEAKAAYLKALEVDQKYAKAQLNMGILADLYLNDLPLALKHYKIYQVLQTKPDKAVSGWIKDLQRRIDRANKP